MTPQIGDAYERYMRKITVARGAGYSDKELVGALLAERLTIMPRAEIKAATLAKDRNPYKAREAMRAARECIDAIDRICKELEPKEITA